MDPGATPAQPSANLADGVEPAGVDVARMEADDGRTVDWRQLVGDDSPLSVGRDTDHPFASQPEHAQRFENAHVHFIADDDRDWWRADPPCRPAAPPWLWGGGVRGGPKAGEVGHRCAGGEADLGIRGQT